MVLTLHMHKHFKYAHARIHTYTIIHLHTHTHTHIHTLTTHTYICTLYSFAHTNSNSCAIYRPTYALCTPYAMHINMHARIAVMRRRCYSKQEGIVKMFALLGRKRKCDL